MRLPYLRKAAHDVLATARAQRSNPAEVVRVLLNEEATSATDRRFCNRASSAPSALVAHSKPTSVAGRQRRRVAARPSLKDQCGT